MKYQDILKLSAKGQVTIPRNIRKELKMEESGLLACKVTSKGLLLFPVSVRKVLSEDEV